MTRPAVVRLLLALTLLPAACGDDDAAPETTAGTTTSTAAVSTTVASSTTSTLSGPFAEFRSSPVEDPFSASGYHQMELAGDGSYLISSDGLPGGGRLALGDFGLPAATGIGADQRLVIVWSDQSPEDIPPFAVALYRLETAGWSAQRVFLNSSILDFLESTTDYQARMPAGPAVLHVFPSSFTWDGSLARMIAGVEVYDDLAATNVIYEGEVDCALGEDDGGCVLLSDDGVLRPGDVSDAVRMFEEDLSAVGYFPDTPDTIYDATTEAAVRVFQRDYRLTVDGKAGPQTITLADDLRSGASDIVMAHGEGVQGVSFGSTPESALPALIELLGSPDYTIGWETGPCGTWKWYKVTWGGFTAWFTERSGSRQFDGWQVTDLGDVPANLYFAGGIAPGDTWSDLQAIGGEYDSFYGWWRIVGYGYNLGEFTTAGSPSAGSAVLGWGVGTGAILYDC